MKNMSKIIQENKSKALNITEKEYAVLDAIFTSDYNGASDTNYPVWTSIVHEDCGYNGKTFSGIVSSLTEKNMVISSEAGTGAKKKDDATILATELGKKAYENFKSILNLKKEVKMKTKKETTTEKAPVAKKENKSSGVEFEIKTPATEKKKSTKTPAPKKEKVEKAPSAYGTAVKFMTEDQTQSFEGLMTRMNDAGFDVDANKSAIRTAHSQTKKIINLLIANGWKAPKNRHTDES